MRLIDDFKIIEELKSTPIDPKIRSFFIKFFGERSCPLRVKKVVLSPLTNKSNPFWEYVS